MIDALANAFTAVQAELFESLVQPVLFATGQMRWQEDAYLATEWFLLGAIQIALLYVVLRPLESWTPAERWNDRGATRVDVIYTVLVRLGVIPLVIFLMISPLADALAEQLRGLGFAPLNIDQIWPGVTDRPLVSFLAYLVILDFADYWVHRAQHRYRWWWALHSLHHSQRQMSFWTDDRNHLLDDLLRDLVKVGIALVIGVEPGQFVALIVAARMLESMQHANVRWSFGSFGTLVVSPIFHRRHHAIGVGHEGRHHGCNFAVLFPWWDLLFATADMRRDVEPTGIRDQLPAPLGSGRNYGQGFWSQQWLGLCRMFGAAN